LKPIAPKALQQVLHYFSFFNHALSAKEILRYIAVPASLDRVKEGLRLLASEGLVYEKQGWFALDSESPELRIEHEQLNKKRLKLARTSREIYSVLSVCKRRLFKRFTLKIWRPVKG